MTPAMMQPLTVHDYLELPEHGPRYQLIEGDLQMAPAPNLFHQRVSRRLSSAFDWHLQSDPRGEVFSAPVDVFLTDLNVYQPDLVYVSREKSRLLRKSGVHGAPDLVAEILSPSTERFDLGSKKRVYSRCGVLEYWIIDPEAYEVRVYDLRTSTDEPLVTLQGEDQLTTKLLPGLVIALPTLFADPL